MSRHWIVVCGLAFISCGSSPPPPAVDAPGGTQTINGSERIGWDQAAADAVELAIFGYAIYVDGARTVASDVSCASAPNDTTFACTARLPSMTAGAHTLELASFVDQGTLLESARSAPLHVMLAAQTASIASAPSLRDGLAASTSLVSGLTSPTDLAFAPDGRLFVAERSGLVRIVRDGRLLDDPAISLTDVAGSGGQLLAIAVDPQFARTHYVFMIYTTPDRFSEPAFTLARFREVSDTLGDRAVLLDAAPAAASSPSAALRFGPDGKLYAAYDDGGDARQAQDPSSLSGKVLRLNADGTTPADAPGSTPIWTSGSGSPIAIDWDPSTATMWMADRRAGSASFTFYSGTLFPEWSGRLLSADDLFDGQTAAQITRIAVGPDGAIYYATATGIGRIAPGSQP
ncbi:MAG: PQQ-dependent sugar dehydrogenase [Vicinamibacterales bacterium]